MRLLLIFFLIFISTTAYSQRSDEKLAQHYYSAGEFDKALVYYEKLYNKQPNKYFFKRYYECLEVTGDLKSAEKVLKRSASRNSYDNEYAILLAQFYEEHDEPDKANKIYDNLIDDLPPSSGNIIQLYNAFKAQGKTEMSYRTLLKGRKLLKKSYNYKFKVKVKYYQTYLYYFCPVKLITGF